MPIQASRLRKWTLKSLQGCSTRSATPWVNLRSMKAGAVYGCMLFVLCTDSPIAHLERGVFPNFGVTAQNEVWKPPAAQWSLRQPRCDRSGA